MKMIKRLIFACVALGLIGNTDNSQVVPTVEHNTKIQAEAKEVSVMPTMNVSSDAAIDPEHIYREDTHTEDIVVDNETEAINTISIEEIAMPVESVEEPVIAIPEEIPVTEDELSSAIAKCNPNVISLFYSTGGTFKIAESISNTSAGEYNYVEFAHGIILEHWIELTNGLASTAIEHELGHFLDKYNDTEYGYASDTPEWISITNTEWINSGLSDYYAVPVEFFAESYNQYRNNPEFASTCPLAYAYMARLDSELDI